MRKRSWRQIIGMFFLNLLIVAVIEVFFFKIGVWQYDRPWLAISIKSLSLALVFTLVFNWDGFKSILKNDSRE